MTLDWSRHLVCGGGAATTRREPGWTQCACLAPAHIGGTAMTIIARRNFVITNAAAITASTCSILLANGLANIASASPLHDAAKEGDLARIEQLLAQGADINERAGPATSLHIAIQQGHAKAAELLIKRGADVNATSTWGTPVYLAASAGLTDIVRLSGQSDSARREVAEALRIRPDLSVSLLDKFPFADRPSLEHYITGFRLAGFPEKADASC
jgi:ankyrin repeat protein